MWVPRRVNALITSFRRYLNMLEGRYRPTLFAASPKILFSSPLIRSSDQPTRHYGAIRFNQM